MKTFHTSVSFSLGLLAFFAIAATTQASQQTCPDYHGDYCCGVTSGDIQSCTSPLHIEQKAIEGGQSYTFFNDKGKVILTLLADGNTRPLDGDPFTGDETTTCSGSSVILDAPNAGISDLPHAKGFYRYSVFLRSDGFMTFREDCSFSNNGVPVGTSCGIGTGYGCRKK